MTFHLASLPKPDGAPMNCSVDIREEKWPYVSRCKNKAVGLLMEQDIPVIEKEFHLGGRMVCQEHADLIDSYLQESK